MQNTAQPLLAFRLTGSSFDLGLIGFASTLPTFFLALPAGVLVERVDKRKLVIAMQVVMMLEAFALAWLDFANIIQIWQIIVLTLVLGIVSAIEITSRQAMLIELAGREALSNAIALQSTAFNLSRVIGPSLAALCLVLIPKNGEGWVFFLNGVSYFAIIIGLLFVRTPYKVYQEEHFQNPVSDFLDGFRYILDHRIIILLILIAAWVGLVAFPITQQIPAIAQVVLAHRGDTNQIVDARSSSLYTAQGVGALIAAGMVALNSVAIRRKGRLMMIGEYAYILGMLGVASTSNVPFTLIIIGIMGWGSVSQLAMMNTLIQLEVPDGFRGRVFSVYLWALQGVAPLGSLIVGWLSQVWGVPQTSIACGVASIIFISVIHGLNPGIRRVES